jgi:hypothetical protein
MSPPWYGRTRASRGSDAKGISQGRCDCDVGSSSEDCAPVAGQTSSLLVAFGSAGEKIGISKGRFGNPR